MSSILRLSGLASGMDTDAIIEQLMKVQRQKATKIENKITTTEWKQEKWKALNSKVYSFYTNQLSKLRLQTSYLTKKAVSSNADKVEIISTASNAPQGTQTIQVKQLASAQFVTGAKLGEGVNSETKLKDLAEDLNIDLSEGYTIYIENGSKKVEFDVRESTTLGDYVNALKRAGLNANYDTTHRRLFISSKESGVNNAFYITATSNNLAKDRYELRNYLNYDSLDSNIKNKIDGYLSDYLTAADKTSIRNNLLDIKHQQVRDEFIDQYINDATRFANAENEVRNSLEEGESLSDEEFKEKVLNYLKNEANEKLDQAYEAWKNNDDSEISSDSDILKAYQAFKEAENGLDTRLNAYSNESVVETENSVILNGLGLGAIVKDENNDKETIAKVEVKGNNGVQVVYAQDAVVIYNNAELTGSSNTFSVNGLTLSLKGVTSDGEQVNVTVSNNTEAIYNMIKDFVKAYNELLSEFNKAYYADSAYGYEPLTDEEKEKMTDDQIEKWENKIKDSLLRRDTSLGTLINIFRNITSQTVMVDDTKYSLASFGITTKNYSEKGILYISGDEDMSASAYSDNKLKEAISNDPDTVMQVFTTLASNLYKSLSDQMKSTSLSSALTVYNDKELDKTLRNYKTQLSDLEDRLDKMEERYYQQFSAMESALEKLNAQSSYLSALLGTNNK